MADYSVSCDDLAIDKNGVLYSLAVYTNGEGYNSYVYSASDVGSRNAPNVQTELLDIQKQLTAIWRSPTGLLYVADGDGEVHVLNGKTWSKSTVSKQALTCLWGLSDSEIFAAGDDGFVYRSNGGKSWSALGGKLGQGSILSIRGSGASDIYAVGSGSMCSHWDGSKWTAATLGTKETLTSVLVLDAKDVLICGNKGTLLRGAGTQWNAVTLFSHDFKGAAQFQGKIYLTAAGDGIFTFDGKSLTSIKNNIPFYRLVSNEHYLGATSGSRAVRFDGTGWFAATYS